MAWNNALAQFNRDRALARRQKKQRVAEGVKVRRCSACGGVVEADEPALIVANGRKLARVFHRACAWVES